VKDRESAQDGDLLPVLRAGDIPAEETPRRWLVESLWASSAVGWIAGSPKCCKSWLGLDMAVSVATATACLGAYRVLEPGRAVVYLAEDTLPRVRERLSALCAHRGIALESVDLLVITEASLRLDLARDQLRLERTVRALRPKLLLLDPLVRLHRLDENAVAEVTALLSYFRDLQRQHELAVVLVHHTRKNNASNQQAGQGLRGTGDLHAWSDSSLYLRRRGEEIVLTIEHRSEPTPQPVSLRLVSAEPGTAHLEVAAPVVSSVPTIGERNRPELPPLSLPQRILAALKSGPLERPVLRDRLAVKNERLGLALQELKRAGAIERHASEGWILTATDTDTGTDGTG
jgi:hypothetical protein